MFSVQVFGFARGWVSGKGVVVESLRYCIGAL
jgi:hypothetical protein